MPISGDKVAMSSGSPTTKAHWSNLAFAAGVDRVSASKGALAAVVLGNQVKGGAIQRFLYVSMDSGRTWRFHSQLPNLKN